MTQHTRPRLQGAPLPAMRRDYLVSVTVIDYSVSSPPGRAGGIDGRVTKGVRVAKAKPSQQKRARERARQERQKEKELRRQENKARRAAAGPRPEGEEDPDIAGIVPGPQPPLWDEEDETK